MIMQVAVSCYIFTTSMQKFEKIEKDLDTVNICQNVQI